jgi:hypothetical protein
VDFVTVVVDVSGGCRRILSSEGFMRTDRYLKVILTVIALELLWLGVQPLTPAVSAQAAATPVVITGIQLADGVFLPAGIVGSYSRVPGAAANVLRPLTTRVEGALSIQQPVKIETDRALLVQQVDYTPRARPGE